MGFNKIVISGNDFELYEYEKNIYSVGRKQKRSVSSDSLQLLVSADDRDLIRQQKEAIKFTKRKDSVRRATMAFRRLVACNLAGGAVPIFLTLTYAENMGDIKQGYSDLTSFVQALRYQFGKDFKYIAVPEFQKRGALHFHALVWGLSSTLCESERSDRRIAKIWGHGFIDIFSTDGDEAIAGYMAKYMTKMFLDQRLKNQKTFVSSRNCLRPIVISGIDNVDVIMADYGVGDKSPVRQVDFLAQWLGKGRFSLFKI